MLCNADVTVKNKSNFTVYLREKNYSNAVSAALGPFTEPAILAMATRRSARPILHSQLFLEAASSLKEEAKDIKDYDIYIFSYRTDL